MDDILYNTILPKDIIFILKKYIPYCFFCKHFSQPLEIEFSNLLKCYCDIDNIFCIHNVEYICTDCSITCKCGGIIAKKNAKYHFIETSM